ncbi:biotin--[acetyl-CoA-carboxylase] ligase [Deinococcus alpinitundrae]|uniref:biotin--[acetyl-CoA-carboxylase] ligase n=1 Tax=Deinococcus alpinitundrae TaxID=468913 RepID=UPI001ED93349|nr:biotin--[acetyl-CoA-carboxylase] ligase [Deinococcus alpinitundrae]
MTVLPDQWSTALLAALTERPQLPATLAARLGLHPDNLAELADQLRELGVPLETSVHGHALRPGTPTPAALRAAGFSGAYRYQPQVGSTQDELRRWADDAQAPAPAGAALLAESQTAGRGRRGRVWQAAQAGPPGAGLTFSVLLAPLQLSRLPLLPLAAGVALREACLSYLATAAEPAAGVPGLKWPNDLITPQGRKLAGILLEAELRGGSVRRAVLGIGLNVTAAPGGAACLADLAPGRSWHRAELLAAILRALEHWLSAPDAEILDAWREANFTLGRWVQVQTSGGPVSGQAQALTGSGELQVVTDAGELLTIGAGDVALIGALAAEAPR